MHYFLPGENKDVGIY
jgi:hypothetical protein